MPDNETGYIAALNRPRLFGVMAFLILAPLFASLIYQHFSITSEQQKKESYSVVENAKERLEQILTNSLAATKILSFFIDPSGAVKNFDSVSTQILSTHKGIDILELVPNGVIQYVYPLKGNEAVLGYDILQDTNRNKEAYRAIEKKELFFSGPYHLKQGGFGIVGRLPVFRNEKFWGFSAVVIKMNTLLKAAEIDSTGKSGYYFQLSKVNPGTGKNEFFIQHANKPLQDFAISVQLPAGDWKLSLQPVEQYTRVTELIVLIIIGLLFSVFGGIFVASILRRPQKLDKLVKERTRELKGSESKYRSLIERVSDAFIALDVNWNYTYVNEKAGEVLARDPEALIGKNIWNEFPAQTNHPFYHASTRAMQTQEYQYIEEYSQPLNKWLENHIYPSKDGLTVFFKDVTDIKNITLELKNNEEKYRSLIEQASDGIVITDLEGIILEVNNSLVKLIGYEEEELVGYHISRYLPNPDADISSLRINELMQGRSLLYQRTIVKKDGTTIEVEINSKMASSHTLIGFIRDITERKKHENTLLYQAKLLESVSDAITSLDMNRCIVSWNKACQDLYGFTAEEVTGKSIPELIAFEYPYTNNEEVFKQVFNEGNWKGEFNFIHPQSGETVHLLSSINILKNNEGVANGFIITSNNITNRKKVEEEIRRSKERFELIAQATNDAIWDHDFTKNETWGNKKLYNLYGLDAGEKINFEMFLDRIHTDERENIVKHMNQAIVDKVSSLSEVFLFRTADGYKTFFARPHIKYDEFGNPIRILGAMQDITERERIKKQILKEKELSDSIINSLPGIFYLYDETGKFLRWNNNFEKVTGYSAGEIGAMHPLDFFEERFKPLLGSKIASVFKNGYDNVEANLLLKDKTDVPYYFTGQAIEYEGQSCLMGVGLDFSEKKMAESLMKASEEKFRTIIEQASDGIFIADENTCLVEVNSAGCRMSGYTLTELQQLKFLDVVPPQDLAQNPLLITTMGKGESVINERRLIRKDGAFINVEISAKKLQDGRYQCFVRDITERKKADEVLQQSERKYKLLFYDNPLPMWMTTMPGLDIIDVNEAAIKQYGYSREEFLKINTRNLRPAEEVEAFVKEMEKMPSGVTNTKVWRHQRKDGSIIYVEKYSHQIIYQGERVWLCLAHDVTDKYEAKELLEKSYEDIRQLASNLQTIREDERTSIAREIHDELGQQLTGLKLDLHWLTRKINSSDEEINSKMKESIELINATIASVRKISTDLRPSILDDLGLLPALEWHGEEFEKRSGTKVIFMNNAGDFSVSPEVATGIFRIYQELLTNIARHANASQARVMLNKNENSLCLSVKDNGTGFDPETIKKKKTLGLLGIKERTLLLGGTYEFKSKPGEGTVTTISIPMQLVTIKI